jgi:serine-threonine kinase receptor-associated protein
MPPSQQQQQPISQRKPPILATQTNPTNKPCSKVWDTYTGECLHTLQHAHIVRSVAFPIQANPQVLATGGAEKKLRIFDLTRGGSSSTPPTPSASSATTENGVSSYEIGAGVHNGTIKSIVWNQDYNVVTTAAEDRKVRWWDLRSRHPIVELGVDGPIGSCELNNLATRPNDSGILTVAAGKSVYLYDGVQPGRLLKKVDFDYDVASAAVNSESGRLVTGSANDTWARVYDLNTNEELGMYPRWCCDVGTLVATLLILMYRGSKGSPWSYLVCQFLPRWQALRNR